MNRTAIAKRLGGAALILGLAVALFFPLRGLLRMFVAGFDAASRDALTVVGVHATPDQAGNFMGFALVALCLVCGALRGRK